MNLEQVIPFLSKNIHLVILGLYAYVLLQIEETEYTTMILLTVATCLAICYLKTKVIEGSQCGREHLEQFTNKQHKQQHKQHKPKQRKVKEGFDNAPDQPNQPVGTNIVRQLPSSMGAYDGLCLQSGNKENWMKTPDNVDLIPNNALFTYLGSQGPEKPVFSDNSALSGPPIDGQPDSDKKMFMFANNRSSPNCCPSTYSTSTGCICTTKNQRDFVASRGVTGSGSHIDLQDI